MYSIKIWKEEQIFEEVLLDQQMKWISIAIFCAYLRELIGF